MTIVCTDGNVMAADTLLDDDGTVSYGPKIFKSKKAVIGIAGDYKHALRFVAWYNDRRKKQPTPEDEFEAITYSKRFGLEYWDSDLEPQKIRTLPYAIGSGWQVAIGAMEFGATPKEGAEIACKRVVSCGGEVTEEEFQFDTIPTRSIPNEDLRGERLRDISYRSQYLDSERMYAATNAECSHDAQVQEGYEDSDS